VDHPALEILYLAATPGLPAFFQQLVPTLNRPQVVATLCALAVGLFVVHVACDRGRTHLESKIGQALSGAQPEALVGITSLRFTNVLTNSLRGVIAPTFAIPLMGYLVLTAPGVVAMLLAFTGIIALVLKSHWERFFTWWQSHPVEMISTSKVLSSSTFLAGFGVILFQLLGKTDPSLVIAVTSLIALRLLMNQVNDEVAALQTHGRQGWVWPSQRPADTSGSNWPRWTRPHSRRNTHHQCRCKSNSGEWMPAHSTLTIAKVWTTCSPAGQTCAESSMRCHANGKCAATSAR